MFAVKLTEAGLAAFADAVVNSAPVIIGEIAIGDGGGAPIAPTGEETALYNEIGRHPTTAVTIHDEHDNWIVVEAVVPAESGGYTIREVGIYSNEGTLLAIASYPEQYKPEIAEGFGEDLTMRLIMMVVNASQITIEDGGSVVYATRVWLEQRLSQVVNWYTLNW